MKVFSPQTNGNGATDPGHNEALAMYEKIRGRFAGAVDDTRSANPGFNITPTNGKFFRNSSDFDILQTRYAGFDKLFLTLIQGVVDDPDYALRKDPQIYSRMMRDPQIYYCLNVRQTATSSLPWQIVPPDEFSTDSTAIKLAEAATARIKMIPQFREMLKNILADAMLKGLSVTELIWKLTEQGQYVVSHAFPEDKDRFKFTREGQLQLLQPRSPTYGSKVPQYKFIAHRFQIRGGSWNKPTDAGYVFYGQGLADTPLYHYFYFKVTALRYMLQNLQRNSSPFKVYYTGAMNAQLASKMDQIMAALQNDSVVGIPGKKGDTNVDVETPRGGADLYIGLIDYVDRLITRAILGQELMTEMPSVGSYAAAQVHASVFTKIAENDRDLLQDTLNSTLMRYDATLNTPDVPENMRPVFRFKSSALVDTATFLSTVGQALEMGLSVAENQVRELSGLRKPMPDEEVLTPPEPTDKESGDSEEAKSAATNGKTKSKAKKAATKASKSATESKRKSRDSENKAKKAKE